jgi:ActD protein
MSTASFIPAEVQASPEHSLETPGALYGLLAEFEEHEQVLAAAERAYAAGYREMDAFSPFPIEGLAEALGHHYSAVPLITLLGGMAGGLGGYFMEWYSMGRLYPLNVGGRPLNSWPNFIPITFELTVLIAALSALVAMLALNRLPEPHHPLFNVPEFRRASIDRFFLCIEATDPKFDRVATSRFLQSLGPCSLKEVNDE